MKFTQKGKVYFVLTILFAALLFVWLLIAVLLTGGRDVGDFTDADKKMMLAFAVVELVTLILTLVFANKAGKENREAPPRKSKTPATVSEKTIRARGIALQALALLMAYGCGLLGILVGKTGGEMLVKMSLPLMWFCYGLMALLLAAGIFLQKHHVKKIEGMQLSRLHEMILSHRVDPEKTAMQKLSQLKKIRVAANIYGWFLSVVGCYAAFCGGIVAKEFTTIAVLISAIVIMGGFSRLRLRTPQSVFQEDKTYVTPQDYPKLYALARKAADQVGCKGEIRISVQADERAGIFKVNADYVLLLGVILLHMYTEEELYHIMLHEFSHVEQENHADQKEQQYYNWLRSGKTPHYTGGISNAFFLYLDGLYGFTYMLYSYAVSIGAETAADQAMMRWGDPRIAASALLKLKYYELYEWEFGGRDERNLYIEPEPGMTVLTDRIRDFHQAMEERKDDWNRLMEAEILSRGASHPTVKMRLEQFGVPNPKTMPLETDSTYYQECCRLLEHLEALVRENRKETYAQQREYYYQKPLKTVEQWEAAGKPLVAEEYADVVWSLRALERTEDALAFLERAIQELPPAASCFAYFTRGLCRLYRYDPAGLEDLYFAVENNSNYIDEALSVIGQFCCLTGNQKELDVFRQKAVLIGQKDKDVYSQLGQLTKKDTLSTEKLPEGMLEALLTYITSADHAGAVENVYLVRKTITEDFFTSAVVVRFTDGADPELCDQLMHKIFSYLDTSTDWQFSLFDYEDVKKVKVERIEHSCVYEKEKET